MRRQVTIESQHGDHGAFENSRKSSEAQPGPRRLEQLSNASGGARVPADIAKGASQVSRGHAKRGERRRESGNQRTSETAQSSRTRSRRGDGRRRARSHHQEETDQCTLARSNYNSAACFLSKFPSSTSEVSRLVAILEFFIATPYVFHRVFRQHHDKTDETR